MKKKELILITVVLFICILLLPTLLWLSFENSKETKLEEKRQLAPFPSRIHRGVISEFDSWYKDHTPYRNQIIEFYKNIDQRIRKAVDFSNLYIPQWFKEKNYEYDTTIYKSYLAPVIDNEVVYGREDWLFYAGDSSLDFYKGTNNLNISTMVEWEKAFEELNSICKKRGINLVIVISPNKEQVFPEYMPSFRIENFYKREQRIYDFMISNSDVHYLYLLDEMQSIKEKYAPYYKQDTHWNSVGAFIGVMAVYKELGFSYNSIDSVPVITKTIVGGDLSSFCGYSSEYDDYVVVYKPETNVDVTPITGNMAIYESDVNNETTLVLLGDSFRSASAPFFVKDFNKSYVCHRSYITEELENGVRDLKEGDVIVIMAVERYDYANLSVANHLTNLLAE